MSLPLVMLSVSFDSCILIEILFFPHLAPKYRTPNSIGIRMLYSHFASPLMVFFCCLEDMKLFWSSGSLVQPSSRFFLVSAANYCILAFHHRPNTMHSRCPITLCLFLMPSPTLFMQRSMVYNCPIVFNGHPKLVSFVVQNTHLMMLLCSMVPQERCSGTTYAKINSYAKLSVSPTHQSSPIAISNCLRPMSNFYAFLRPHLPHNGW
mmetsp:Transcript_1275/g.1767  ORF Transcript_1275/g.1767 Transcript_1275/m.1767 type:complete len:207 (+) Transcript_1275:674-1294(+)